MSQQQCFLCKGKGQISEYPNNQGRLLECPSCSGLKTIPSSYIKCPHCQNGLDYPYPNNQGNPSKCKLCQGLSYITTPLEKCLKCDGLGKHYPYSNNQGNPIECNNCFGKGFQSA